MLVEGDVARRSLQAELTLIQLLKALENLILGLHSCALLNWRLHWYRHWILFWLSHRLLLYQWLRLSIFSDLLEPSCLLLDYRSGLLDFFSNLRTKFWSLKLSLHCYCIPLLLRSSHPLLWLLNHLLLRYLCHGCSSVLSYVVTEFIRIDLLPRALLMDLDISSRLLLLFLFLHFFILCEALLLSKLFCSLTLVNFHLLLWDVCLLARFLHIFTIAVLRWIVFV